MKTPTYIKALLQPNGQKAPSRRVWSIDLEGTWVPFFTATNVMGETTIPSEDLGAPLRLVKAKDGSVKFTQSGRPSLKVAPMLNSHITMVRENFVATLQAYTGKTLTELKDEYRAQVEAAQKAAIPIHRAQADAIEEALALLRKADADAIAQAEAIVEAQPEPEAVAA